jgi:hypothetical protein
MAQEINATFGIPSDVPAPATEDRIAALRAKAAAQVAAEFDEDAVFAKLLAEEKAKREESLRDRAAEEAVPPVGDADAHGFPRRYVWLTIARGNQAHDSEFCPVGINGHVWKIRRGEKVAVHDVVVKVLENAIGEVLLQTDGGLSSRPTLMWPFSVHGPCSEAEYLAYRAKMQAMTAQQAALAAAA